MEDYLAGGSADIEKQLVTVQFSFFRDIARRYNHFSDKDFVRLIFIKVFDGLDMFSRYNQYMRFSFRMDIVKRDEVIIFIDDLRRDLFIYDLAE